MPLIDGRTGAWRMLLSGAVAACGAAILTAATLLAAGCPQQENVVSVARDDPAMVAAIAEARRTLPAFEADVRAGSWTNSHQPSAWSR